MTCVVLQPSYIPWRGHIHQIQKSDVFVFYDDVQYDKHGWRNRNRIKGPNGLQWLTVPVYSKGNVDSGLLIKDVRIDNDSRWSAKHQRALTQSYKKAPYFDAIWEQIEPFYQRDYEFLAEMTIDMTRCMTQLLGLTDKQFVRSSQIPIRGGQSQRLVEICLHFGENHYVTGPAAKAYLDERAFEQAGIRVEFMRYEYPEYEQLYSPYENRVSIVDLLFMEGPNAAEFIWPDKNNVSRQDK